VDAGCSLSVMVRHHTVALLGTHAVPHSNRGKYMSRMLKNIISALVLCASMGVQAVAAKAYTIGVVDFWMPYGIAYVASEKGFWKREGIDVDVKLYKGDDAVMAFRHGKLDFYNLITSEAIEFINNHPANLFIYEYDISNGGDKLILANRINNLDALKGETVGLYLGTAGVRFFLHKVLADGSNITLADIQTRVVKNAPSLSKAFKRGSFAAVMQFGSEADQLVDTDAGHVAASSADYLGVIGDGIITRKKLVKEHPDVIRKLLRGWMRATVWAFDPKNRDEFLDILNRTVFKSDPQSTQSLLKMQSEVIVHHTRKGVLAENGAHLSKFTTEVLDYLKQSGAKLRSSNSVEYVDTSIALDVAKKVFK